jgi:hypothetical protein
MIPLDPGAAGIWLIHTSLRSFAFAGALTVTVTVTDYLF